MGCGNKAVPVQTAASPDTNATASAPAVAEPAPVLNPIVVPQPTTADDSRILGALTQALRQFAVEHKRMPQDFSEIVRAGYVKDLPPPPPGKEFAIDAKTTRVVLVNR